MPNRFSPNVRMKASQFDRYVRMIERTRGRFAGRLDVKLGLESDYFPGYEPYLEALHRRADFDYVIGSVHWQSRTYLGRFANGDAERFRRTYFTHLAESAETGLYDCLGHPDHVKHYEPRSWSLSRLRDDVAACLDRIAASGVAMELNTSGIDRGYTEMSPGNALLRMMAERGIPVVLGSDAHSAERVGAHFVRGLRNLRAAGYREVNYFERRRRKALAIDAVLAGLRALPALP